MELDETLRKTILKAATDYFTENLEFTQSLKLTTTLNVIVDFSQHYEYVASDEIKRSDTWLTGTSDVQTGPAGDVQTGPAGDSSIILETLRGDTLEVKRVDADLNDDTTSYSSHSDEIEPYRPSTPLEPPHIEEGPGETLLGPNEVSPCPICLELYQNQAVISNHLMTRHGNYCDKEFICLICDHPCLNVEGFAEHWLGEHKGMFVEEEMSEAKSGKRKKKTKEKTKNAHSPKAVISKEKDENSDFKRRESLKIRIKTNPSMRENNKNGSEPMTTELVESNTECGLCGKVYRTERALNRHYSVVHGNLVHICDICNKTFNSKEGLYHHKRGLHSDVKAFKCSMPGCDASFNFNHSLKLHILKHTGARPYKCNVCDKTYLTSYHLKVHYTGVHAEKKEYTCKTCGKGFSYSTSLRVHEATHSEQPRESCGTCGKTFVNAQALKYHHMSKHAEPGHFKCQKCSKVYKSEILLKAHERRHTKDNSRFMCDICGRCYMYKSALEMHKSVHGDEKSFSCKICDKAFKTYATLYSHMFVHREESSFKCETCDKAFKTKERMKAHARRHAGTKPFECQICHHCFPDNGGLSKHMKTVHCPVKKFICDICGKSTTRADNLRVHMKVHAKSNVKPTMTVEQSKVPMPREELPSTVPLIIDADYDAFEPAKKPKKPKPSKKVSKRPSRPFNYYAQSNEMEAGTMADNQSYHANMPHFSTIDSSQLPSSVQSAPPQYHDYNSVTASPVNCIPNHIANENMVIINTDNTPQKEPAVNHVPSTVTSGTISVTPMQNVNYMYAWPYVFNQAQQQTGPPQNFYQQ